MAIKMIWISSSMVFFLVFVAARLLSCYSAIHVTIFDIIFMKYFYLFVKDETKPKKRINVFHIYLPILFFREN